MKTRSLILALALSSGFLWTSCKEQVKESEATTPTEVDTATTETKVADINLTFASEGYATKEEGSDWVKINLKSTAPDQVSILVTSREDIKKPTCSLETVATKLDEHTYQAILQEAQVNFSIQDGKLTIDTVKKSDRSVLSYYCSGGGSLQGSYTSVE